MSPANERISIVIDINNQDAKTKLAETDRAVAKVAGAADVPARA